MKEKQALMVRACGSVYMEYVIDWATFNSYFRVSDGSRVEYCVSAYGAELEFNRMTKKRGAE